MYENEYAAKAAAAAAAAADRAYHQRPVTVGHPPVPTPATINDRLNRLAGSFTAVNGRVEGVLNRIHGPQPTDGRISGAEKESAMPPLHYSVDRIEEQILRLNILADMLEQVA